MAVFDGLHVKLKVMSLAKENDVMNHISIILADEGSNLKLAETIQHYLKDKPVSVSFINLLELDLPLYTYPKELELGIPKNVSDMVECFQKSTAFVVVSPEYNGSIPPVLSNAIAWATRATMDWRSSFNEKSVGLASYSYTGAANLFVSLRIQLSYIGLNVLARPVAEGPNKPFNQDDLVAMCNQLIQ